MDAAQERELVERCRRGDDLAFQELIDGSKHLVFGLIARSVPDRSRTEDLSQEVYLRIHRGLPYFRGEARLTTWIFRIVANVCAQEHARRRAAAADAGAPPPPRRAQGGSPDRRFTDMELQDRLEKAIARLPADQALLVGAHYLDGVQYEALAEALGVPLGTIKTRLYRAKRQLRRLLETELA